MSTQTATPDLCYSAARILRATSTCVRWTFAGPAGTVSDGSLTIEIRAGDDDAVTAWPRFDLPARSPASHSLTSRDLTTCSDHATRPDHAARPNHSAGLDQSAVPETGRLEPFSAVASIDRATRVLSIDAGDWLSVSISIDTRTPRLLFARTSLLKEHGISGPGTDAPALATMGKGRPYPEG